ncbi:hypothetical protein JCM11251_004221 [Rhodosporidiobolus azoricus]
MASIVSDNPYSATSSSVDQSALDERLALSLRLIDAILEHEDALVRKLVEEEHVECWVQDRQGWTALHAAAYTGSVDHLRLLLRKGNAVWSMVDNLGCTAGDIAFSMNHADCYQLLLEEGVRAEMLRAILEAAGGADSEEEDEEMIEDGAEVPVEGAITEKIVRGGKGKSTSSDNALFLSTPLNFTRDSSGQPIALDAEGNGVMMGWETDIMRETVDAVLADGEKKGGCWAGRRVKSWEELKNEEEGERETLNVVNVGFGLGIVDTFLQSAHPSTHLIIEPHPSVLAFARENGWYNKPGVRYYEGTWKQWLKDLEEGKEEGYGMWDVVYFDTYSEHYSDLHLFFQALPDLLSSSPSARFSFFHGLGATSRLLYDVYTTVSELHLREIGIQVGWREVDVGEGGKGVVGRWSGTGTGEGDLKEGQRTMGEGEKKYWREEMVGRYRLPVGRLSYD